MKLFYLLAFILSANTIWAQQSFQGTIVYKYNIPHVSDVPEIMLQFGPNKIKVKFKDKKDFDDQMYMLIDFDSGKLFTVNTDTKTFFSRKLSVPNTKQVTTNKIIAGYKTNSITLSTLGFGGGGGMLGFGPSGTTVLFPASELYYPVPEQFVADPSLIMIQNNHIVLGAELRTGRMSDEMPDSLQQQISLTIEAIKVDPNTWNVTEFSIPADFTKMNWSDMRDSEVTVVDTVYFSENELHVPPPPPPPPPPAKKKTPTKTEAIKPKKTQTKS